MYHPSQYALNSNPLSRSAGYSRLEYIAEGIIPLYSAQASAPTSLVYSRFQEVLLKDFNYNSFFDNPQSYNSNSQNYILISPQAEYHFIPDHFLKPGKEGIFVGEAGEIKEFVEDAFRKLFGISFPIDIKINVLDAERFRKLAPHPETIGLSFNRRKLGLLSEIFVLNDSLGRVMLTIGHELGHVLTETLENPHNEEAKAYAFSLAWMKVIKENNIANLGEAIVTERPAENGLHNVAFFFIEKLMREGKKAWEVYLDFVGKKRGVNFLF